MDLYLDDDDYRVVGPINAETAHSQARMTERLKLWLGQEIDTQVSRVLIHEEIQRQVSCKHISILISADGMR